jgi:hypothetical protein
MALAVGHGSSCSSRSSTGALLIVSSSAAHRGHRHVFASKA